MEACGYQDLQPSRSPFTDLVFWPVHLFMQDHHAQQGRVAISGTRTTTRISFTIAW